MENGVFKYKSNEEQPQSCLNYVYSNKGHTNSFGESKGNSTGRSSEGD